MLGLCASMLYDAIASAATKELFFTFKKYMTCSLFFVSSRIAITKGTRECCNKLSPELDQKSVLSNDGIYMYVSVCIQPCFYIMESCRLLSSTYYMVYSPQLREEAEG